MARRIRKSSKRSTYRRRMRGGAGATEYTTQNYGGMDAQLARFDSSPSNALTNVHGQSINGVINSPTPAQLAMIQGGGRRRKSKKNKKGGFLGSIVNQAIVPLGIFGMQQSFKRKHNHTGYQGTRRHR